MKALAILSAFFVIGACFFPWVDIESKNIVVSGIHADGTNFGKPGFLHFFCVGLSLLLLLVNKPWSQKAAVVFGAFNVAWAVRNTIIISACQMGECPEKQLALYVLVPASIVFLIGALLWNTSKQNRSRQ